MRRTAQSGRARYSSRGARRGGRRGSGCGARPSRGGDEPEPASGQCFFPGPLRGFLLHQYERARALFREALQRDRWNRAAHRFLADTEARLGDARGAYREIVLAVVSDPTYEAAWHRLGSLTAGLGGKYHRAFAVKPTVSPEPDGKITIHLTSDPGSESRYPAENSVWVMYGLLRVAEVRDSEQSGSANPEGSWPPAKWRSLSPLERERARVEKFLDVYQRVIADKPDRESGFWNLMVKAREARFLDEAIFMHLIDPELAPAYLEYRDKHADRLVEYVTTILAPLPEPGTRRAAGQVERKLV